MRQGCSSVGAGADAPAGAGGHRMHSIHFLYVWLKSPIAEGLKGTQ